MAATVRGTNYFYATVTDQPGEACRVLSDLADEGVNLLAFSAVPIGPQHVQIAFFPENTDALQNVAAKSGLVLTGPQQAFLVQGDDRLGAIAQIYRKLYEAGVDVYASTGVTDGRGGFGYVLYVRPESYRAAAEALKDLML